MKISSGKRKASDLKERLKLEVLIADMDRHKTQNSQRKITRKSENRRLLKRTKLWAFHEVKHTCSCQSEAKANAKSDSHK